eukprot:1026645-Prorocentrum_minimum.AAC.1
MMRASSAICCVPRHVNAATGTMMSTPTTKATRRRYIMRATTSPPTNKLSVCESRTGLVDEEQGACCTKKRPRARNNKPYYTLHKQVELLLGGGRGVGGGGWLKVLLSTSEERKRKRRAVERY